MTVRYVGPGGSDSNNGLTWANRKLTLNGVEDTPVAAGDVVYVGPGVYRELLTLDVSGSSGNPITYIGDVTGYYTDGVGGVVRITGSNDDETTTRTQAIYGSGKSYRTFVGLSFDLLSSGATAAAISLDTGCDFIIVEDCYFGSLGRGLRFEDLDTSTYHYEIRRCFFFGDSNTIILLGTGDFDSTSIIENCLIIVNTSSMISVQGSLTGNLKTRNCTFFGIGNAAVASVASANASAYNNNVSHTYRAFSGSTVTEDYNNIAPSVIIPRTSTPVGSNSVAYISGLRLPILYSGYQFRFGSWFALDGWSQVARIAGSNEASEDFYGKPRPTASAKKSWGALQLLPHVRETGITFGAESVSTKLPDAGIRHAFLPIVGGDALSISVKVRRESDYAGTLPRMIVREIGQSDRVTTDTGPAGQWNELLDSFTPQSTTRYLVIDFVSDNTATSGNYAVYFGDFVAKVL